jgi:hypothetical protein
VDQQPDAGDDQDHHRRERIEAERPRHLERTDAVRGRERNRRNPVAEVHDVIARLGRQAEQLREGVERYAERERHRSARHQRRRLLVERANADQPVNRGADTRQNRY